MPPKNRSPWLHQLDHDRVVDCLAEDAAADVAIVGAGIAGVSTAYFTLAKTEKTVLLIERARLAHGATGHNAGYAVASFERPLADIEREHGLEKTAAAVRAVERGWELLDEVYTGAGLDISLSRFVWATGLCDLSQVKLFLSDLDVRRRAGLPFRKVVVAEGAFPPDALAELDPSLCDLVPMGEVRAILETENPNFVAAAPEPGGVVNSALFCQEVVRYLARAYPGRFRLIEETKVGKVVLQEGGALLDCGVATVAAAEVVLCTNGFEDFTIVGEGGLCLDREFHRNVRGIVGYMSGYLTPMTKPPGGAAYLRDGWKPTEDSYYFYVSRRPYEYDRGTGPRHSLVSIGGPQALVEDHTAYSFDDDYPTNRSSEIQKFAEETYGGGVAERDRVFAWHGLMGYTPGMTRIVGPHPSSPRLLYNLGCNGIGILMSVWGGETIARHLAGEDVPKTIFTPNAGTC